MIKYVEIENAGGKRGYVFKADFEPKVGNMVTMFINLQRTES